MVSGFTASFHTSGDFPTPFPLPRVSPLVLVQQSSSGLWHCIDPWRPKGRFVSVFGRFFPLNIMLRVSFSPGRDRACRHCWISSFWTPSGKRRLFLFAAAPFEAPWQGIFLDLFINIIENHQQNVFFYFCLPPGRRLLLTSGMGMEGGTTCDHL